MNIPESVIFTGTHGDCHIQGIAVDQDKGYLYYSFTTMLIKADLQGNILGSVKGLTGHLGCIDFHEADGKIYGSLEYKNDKIGKGIHKKLGIDKDYDDSFYIAIFDVDKIDRMDMDAERDGVMTAVCLNRVSEYYKGIGTDKNGQTVPHKYGFSGIDGITFGPMPGSEDEKEYLFVCAGIYGDVNRDDNDNQVILCYDTADWGRYAQPLSQEQMHRSGPDAPLEEFFVYTGNTRYGVQNLEYDKYTNSFFMAVYTGQKLEYPNFNLFAIDATVAPVKRTAQGLLEEKMHLTLKKSGKSEHPEIFGWRFPLGSTGLYAYGDGRYLISQPYVSKTGQCAFLLPHIYDSDRGFLLDL